MTDLNVAVRTLCEFAARKGDLDLRYTPAPTSEEGIAGHGAVQARRGPRYQSEVALAGQCGKLMVSGRADGYDPIAGRLEEIKTHRGDLSRVREAQRNLHLAQLRAYGALLCRQEKLSQIDLALIYYDVGKDKETPITETALAEELWQELEQLCEHYSDWAEQETNHRHERDLALKNLAFPFPDFRPQQRALAETVYRNSVRQQTLLLEAPTGLGKTLGTLFPALMAMPTARQDRLFYLTSRNTARQLAVDAVHLLREKQPGPLPLRTLELVAKDHACEHPDKACHGDACPLAKGFFDRLPAARKDAANHSGALTQVVLADIARQHGICPYFLAQEMAPLVRCGGGRCKPDVRPVRPAPCPGSAERLESQPAGRRGSQPGGPRPRHVLRGAEPGTSAAGSETVAQGFEIKTRWRVPGVAIGDPRPLPRHQP